MFVRFHTFPCVPAAVVGLWTVILLVFGWGCHCADQKLAFWSQSNSHIFHSTFVFEIAMAEIDSLWTLHGFRFFQRTFLVINRVLWDPTSRLTWKVQLGAGNGSRWTNGHSFDPKIPEGFSHSHSYDSYDSSSSYVSFNSYIKQVSCQETATDRQVTYQHVQMDTWISYYYSAQKEIQSFETGLKQLGSMGYSEATARHNSSR